MFTVAPAPTEGLPSPEDVQVPDTSVVALIVTSGALRHELHTSLVKTILLDQEHGWHNYLGELINTSGANISKQRNQVIRRFLDETDAEWAWLIDSDMVFGPDVLPRLLCGAAVTGAKVIGGLCCMVGSDGPIPTTFQLGDFNAGEVTRVMLDYQDNTLVQVAATGMACLLVHRSVLEHMRSQAPHLNYPWVYEAEINGQWVSEDVLFCLRANEAGFPVFVDTNSQIGHVKGSTTWWPSDIRKGRGFPDPKNYAIVPSITRSLAVDTISQLSGQVDRVVLLDNTPTGSLADLASDLTHVIHTPGAGIHEMWNTGIRWAMQHADQRRNVNLHVLNDDLRFGPRFIAQMATALRSEPDLVAVSGNYDGRSGDLVEFVDDICAGRYDGTGGFAGFAFTIRGEWIQSGYQFPEECKWWFGDNDLVLATRVADGKIGIAVDAKVEHLDGGSKTGGDWSDKALQIRRDKAAFEARWQQIRQPVEVRPTDEWAVSTDSVAVVSSIYGGYDQPTHPAAQPEVVDWILVTDSAEPPPAPWRAIHKPRPDVDPRYAGKAAKYQPFLFTDAAVAVWVDGRLEPREGFVRWLLDCLGDADMAIYRHWGRSSILAEAEAALVENPAKYAGRPLVEQAKHYLVDGYDDVNLWQTTFFVVRRNERTLRMGERWMEEQDRFPDCLLDQIPLPPVIAECGVKVVDLPGGFWSQRGRLWDLRPHIDGT